MVFNDDKLNSQISFILEVQYCETEKNKEKLLRLNIKSRAVNEPGIFRFNRENDY